MPFRIRTKLLVALGVMLVPLLGLIVISHFNQRAIYQGIERVEELSREMADLAELQLAIDEVVMPANDYLVHADLKEREEFSRLVSKAEGLIDDISRLEVCGQCHRAPYGILEKVYALEPQYAWPEEMKTLKMTVDGFEIIKEKGEAIFKLERPIGSAEGARLMEEMDALSQEGIKYIARHLEIDKEKFDNAVFRAEKAWRRSWVIMIAGSLLLVAIGISFSTLYSGYFTRPIMILHDRADAIAKGDFKTRLDIKTGDEIEQLAGAMNEMAVQLDSFYSNMQAMVEERTMELKESETRFRSIIETAKDAMICIEQDGMIYQWNKSAEEMFGYSAYEAIGKDIHSLIIPERLKEKAYTGFNEFSKTGTGPIVGKTIEIVGMRKDGTEFPVELSVSAMNIKGAWHAVGIIRDITERKKAEEKIKEQMDYLERFQKVAVKREFRIKELMDEVEGLKARIVELERVDKE